MSNKSNAGKSSPRGSGTTPKERDRRTLAQQRDDQKASQIKQLAYASLLLSSASFVMSCFGCIPGIVCGHIVRAACKRDPNLPGKGLALVGLVIGYAMLLANVIAIVLLLIKVASREPDVDPFENLDL